MPGEISDHDIERELQTLRNLRRRSISTPGPGALAVDPDLPPSPPSSNSSLHTPSLTSNDDVTLAAPDGLDDGSLFWVPAHLHPELAPGEFKAFLKSHAHPDAPLGDGSGSAVSGAGGEAGDAPGLAHSPSWLARSASGRRAGGADGLGRKRSMLSRQYTPRPGDDADEMPRDAAAAAGAQRGDGAVGGGRQRASIYGGRTGERGLTLQDLQRLETLVDGVEDTDDPAKVRNLLRRSLSMNVAPGFLQDDVPLGEEGDATSTTGARSGSIMRRNARTRLRKGGAGTGDSIRGRLASSRRPKRSTEPESEASSLDGHGQSTSASASAEGGDAYISQPQSRKSSDEGGSDEHSTSGSGSGEGQAYFGSADMSIESYEYEERFSDQSHMQGPGYAPAASSHAGLGVQPGLSSTGTSPRQTSYGSSTASAASSRHIEHRRGSDESADPSSEADDGEGVSDTDGIFDAYRNSRESSISEGDESSEWDKSGNVSPESSEYLQHHQHHQQQQQYPSQQGDKKLSLPPLPLSTSYGNDWFAAQGEGEKTPTQESTRDPMGLGLGIRTDGGQALSLDTSGGVGQATPRAGGRDLERQTSREEKATSPTTPQARRQPLPPIGEAGQQGAAQGYELPPGMAPPATRQVVPPGIALQHQRSHEKLNQGSGPGAFEGRAPLVRTDSGASAAPSVASSSGSSVLGVEKKEKKEKEKKSGLFGKKDKKDKDGKKKEKEGFLGSLFGSKKKTEESSVANFATAGPAAAAALLGSSKSAKSLGPNAGTGANGSSPQLSPATPGAVFSPFARYPIHVERAVYRLSHIKLANARRPLYEQVLISNLMFWYLGVIGRNVSEEKKANGTGGAGAGDGEKDGEDVKKGPVPVVAKGTPPKPADRGDANGYARREALGRDRDRDEHDHGAHGIGRDREREDGAGRTSPKISPPLSGHSSPSPPPQSLGPNAGMSSGPNAGVSPAAQPAPAPKKSLVKPERRPGGREAEQAVRMPSYGMQHAQVDSEMRQREAREREMVREREREMSRQQQQQQHRQQQEQQQYNAPPPPQYANQPPPQQHQHHQQPQPQQQTPLLQHQRSYPPQQAPNGSMSQSHGNQIASNPARSPERTRSPPQPGAVPGPGPSGYPSSPHHQPQPQPHPSAHPHGAREIQGPPRGVPQSSFGPPPPPTGGPEYGGQMRQRTLSSPAHGQAPLPPGAGTSGAPGMRRVVTDGRPPPSPGMNGPRAPSSSSSHAGPQPGQIFQYPGGAGAPGRSSVSPPPTLNSGQPFPHRSSAHPAPGQIYSPVPGQGQGPAPGQMYRPPPGPGQMPGQPPRGLPMPGPGVPGHGQGQDGWQQPQRLPPPGHPQHLQQPQHPHQPQRLPPPGAVGPGSGPAPQGYPHQPHARPPPGPGPGSPSQQGFYGRPPPQGQGYPQQHPPQGYPHGHPHAQGQPMQRPPPQGYPAQQQQHQQAPPQGYGRQALPAQQGYAHHR